MWGSNFGNSLGKAYISVYDSQVKKRLLPSVLHQYGVFQKGVKNWPDDVQHGWTTKIQGLFVFGTDVTLLI